MSLWTDGDFVTVADLISLDGEVQEVASADGITLEDSTGSGNGTIHRAIEECEGELMKYLQVFGGYLNSGTVSSNHIAAVMNIGTPSINRSKILIGQIAVSGLNARVWTPIKRWVAYRALYVFFREVANRTLKDRYTEKQETYKKLADGQHWDAIRSLGIPVVTNPLPCPGALWEPNAGTWDASNVTLVAGSGTVAESYDFVISYVDQGPGRYVSPSVPMNAESGASARLPVTMTPGSVARLSIASLVPPTGVQHPGTIAYAVVQYMQATGWNVYAGITGQPLYLQNATPIPIATKTFTLPADPISGAAAPVGQYADTYMSLPMGMLQRG